MMITSLHLNVTRAIWLIVSVVGSFGSLTSQIYWQNLEAPPANVTSIVSTSDNVIVAGTSGATVYRSTDRGDSWDWRFQSGIPFDFLVRDMSVTANDDIYAALVGAGLFRSRDKGLTWQDVTGDLPSKSIIGVSTRANQSGGNSVFIGIDDPQQRLLALYISDNDAGTWRKINNPVGAMTSVLGTAMSPNSNRLFVSVGYNKGLYRSDNLGTSWTRIDADGQGESDDNYSVIRFNAQGHIFVGRNALPASSEIKNAVVMKSTNDGQSWVYLKQGWLADDVTNNRVSGICFGVGNDVIATTEKSGTFYSSNGGDSWVSRIEGLEGDGSGSTVGATRDGSTVLFAPRQTFVYRFVPGGLSSVNESNTSNLLLYPNPATQRFTLSFTAHSDAQAYVNVFDTRGVSVLSSSQYTNAGTSSVAIDASSLPPGVYTAVLRIGGSVVRERVSIVR